MGSGSAQPQQQTVIQSNIPEYARPYYEGLMQRSSSLLTDPYQVYEQERVAGFTPEQQQVQQNILGLQTPEQFGLATRSGIESGLMALRASEYKPSIIGAEQVDIPTLEQYRIGAARDVYANPFDAPSMQAAQTDYDPNLAYFQLNDPQQFGAQQAMQYMSPFIQEALEPQMRAAITDAQRTQLAEDLGAARQGSYGGSRQLLATLGRERTLGQQLGDIRARGLQSAFENAQQQFERDRAAQLAFGQSNLQAALQTQQLGAQTGLQTALANLSNQQQAAVNNQATRLQALGMNAENALRAALANQGVDVTRAQADLQSQLETQRLRAQSELEAQRANQMAALEAGKISEQSRQFGAQQQLAAAEALGRLGQTFGNIGTLQQQSDLSRLGLQTQTAAQEQALQQQQLDLAYRDFLKERDYPLEQLQQYSSLLRGVPVAPSSTTTTYAQAPGVAQQLLGAGLGAASLANLYGG